MTKGLFHGVLLVLVFSWCCASSQAQYLSPEQVKTQKEEQERQRRDREANSYIGKTYWYIPNPDAILRAQFFSDIPTSILNQREVQFFPTSTTSFLVNAVETIPRSYDEYYLKIIFPDNKIGYITPDELQRHLYDGQNYDFQEYIFTKSPQAVIANQRKAAAGGKSKVAPRIGMTKEQALASTWGKPNTVNKTSAAPGAREQWVYGSKYLYFEKGVLVAIDK